jgi:hypothetical protein
LFESADGTLEEAVFIEIAPVHPRDGRKAVGRRCANPRKALVPSVPGFIAIFTRCSIPQASIMRKTSEGSIPSMWS